MDVVCKWSNCLFVLTRAGMLCHAGCVVFVCVCVSESEHLSSCYCKFYDLYGCLSREN